MALVFADKYGTANGHTITISNTDANGTGYEAYPVFKSNLNVSEGLLFNIPLGNMR
jgi:hypothetical protein